MCNCSVGVMLLILSDRQVQNRSRRTNDPLNLAMLKYVVVCSHTGLDAQSKKHDNTEASSLNMSLLVYTSRSGSFTNRSSYYNYSIKLRPTRAREYGLHLSSAD